MDVIYEELNKKIKLPALKRDTIFVKETPSMFDKFLSSKQTVQIPNTEISPFINQIQKNHLIQTTNTEIDVSNVKTISNVFDISEYFGRKDYTIIDASYLESSKELSQPLAINVYNPSTVDCIGSFASEQIKIPEQLKGISLPVVKKIAVTEFTETKYHQGIHISKYMYKFPALSINLPYSLYAQMTIPENIFTYDIENDTYEFAGKSEEEFRALFHDICEHGITRHIFISISDGKFMSTDNDSYLILLIAMHLGIPTIPATLYLISNTKEENLLISDRIADVLWKKTPDFYMDKKSYLEISELCYPYFIFINKSMDHNKSRAINDYNSYVPMKDTTEKHANEYDRITLYMADDPEKVLKEISEIPIPEDPEVVKEKLRKDAEASLHQDIDQIISRIKDGTL